jgi:signal transduction histidine kinase/CheY-like chemotaxis protein
MFPDTSTIVVFSVLLIGFLGLLQLWLWRGDRTLIALAIWGVADLMATVGTALLAARGRLPNWLSIDVAIAVFALAGGLAWVGARRFEHRPAHWGVALAGAAIWIVACRFPGFHGTLTYRVAAGSAIIGAYDLLCMLEFLRPRPGLELPSRHTLGVTFGANAAIQGVRISVALLLGFSANGFSLPQSEVFGFSAMIGVVLIVATSVLLIAVAKEEAEQRSIAAVAFARDTADRANLAKSRFLTRMSHELRTPLNGVLGMAQVLTRDPSIEGVVRERAVLLEKAGRHLLAIINDILDLASVEAGKFQLSPRPSRLADILQGSIEIVAGTAAEKRIALRLAQSDNLPPVVLADPLRVRQILLNLLGNAIKFTPPGGRVALDASWHEVPLGLRLAVTDSGPGVPEIIRAHLFEDFAQRPLDTAASEGTGLGLAISATLARAMGGTLRYQPCADGVGSMFVADLPLPIAAAPAEPAPAPRRSPVQRSGLRVLVVDDVASNRRLADALLQQAGYHVELAVDGASAIAAIARGPMPDVVLMDIFMPDMDGLAATRGIRALGGAAASVPIIAVTADASPDRAQAYREAGMAGCVTKPFMFDDLEAAITDAVAEDAPSPRRSRAG